MPPGVLPLCYDFLLLCSQQKQVRWGNQGLAMEGRVKQDGACQEPDGAQRQVGAAIRAASPFVSFLFHDLIAGGVVSGWSPCRWRTPPALAGTRLSRCGGRGQTG